jgi:hypothetical protein
VIPHTLDDLRAWLDGLQPAERVHLARLLADTRTAGELAAMADATIYELTRHARSVDVAGQLGLSERQVRRAVEQHCARARAAAHQRAQGG